MVKTITAPPARNVAAVDAPENPIIEKMRKEESRMVKGVYQDNELKGGNIKFVFKKYKGDPIVHYHLFDGQEYELPLSVVRHLNSGCAYHDHHFVLDAKGNPTKAVKKTHRFSFKSTEYC